MTQIPARAVRASLLLAATDRGVRDDSHPSEHRLDRVI